MMAAPAQSSRATRKLSDLPIEVQKNIIQCIPRKHLFKLQKVSSHFFSLASAELYANLNFRFTTTGARDEDTPATRLSDALETFAVSDHDYAQYVKSFRLSISQEDSFNATTLARLFWPTGSDPTKMLNMAMLLMLRKAVMMESFLWDVPVELTGPVYRALHKMQSLRNLRIKSAGIPIKLAISPSFATPPGGWAAAPNPGTTIAQNQNQGQAMLSAVPAFTSTPGSASIAKRLGKKAKCRLDDAGAAGAFGGFTGLASIAFTDLTNLDHVTDIANCIKASSTSLRSLGLSLSWDLAQRSRKATTTAPPANDVDDGDFSDDTEDMLNSDLPPPPPAQPITAADAKKDRLAQDAILSKIFDMEGFAAEGKRIEKEVAQSSENLNGVTNGRVKETDFSLLADLAKSLTAALIAKGSQNTQDIQRAVELMSKTTNELMQSRIVAGTAGPIDKPKFLNDIDALDNPVTGAASGFGATAPTNPQPGTSSFATVPYIPDPPIGGPDTSQPIVHKPFDVNTALCDEVNEGLLQGLDGLTPAQAEKAVLETLMPAIGPGSIVSAAFQASLLQNTTEQPSSTIVDQQPPITEDANDDMDLDMDHPDESTIDEGPDQEMVDGLEEPEGSPRKRAKFEESLASENAQHLGAASASVRSEAIAAEAPSVGEVRGVQDSSENTMQKYIRAAHGLQLEEFSLYLIPLKASIVARALDLSVLKRLTLLDVGCQASFWQLLQRLSKSMPDLGFHMIHTDNVSNAFLNFLSTFVGLQELYLHKKKNKDPEPETTGPKVDIKSICKLGLRKHFDTITHLMLRNDNDDSWDLDQWSVRTFSLRGSGFMELAVSMKIQTLHTLVQNITCFTSLRALYFPHLRTSTSGTSSIYEIDPVCFLNDSLIYFPDRKLKYIGVSERYAAVESPADIARRVKEVAERKATMQKKKKVSKGKGKGKEAWRDLSVLQGKGLDDFIAITEDDEEGAFDHMALKVKECHVKWDTKFWQVKDCKIFERGIRLGKLSWGT